MRQPYLHGNRDIRIESVEHPPVGPEDVRVDVETCGICGTDLHEYVHGPVFAPVEEPHPLTEKTLPVAIGHEFDGAVLEAGDDVDRLAVGDRVAIHPILSCGQCRSCEAGKYHLQRHRGNALRRYDSYLAPYAQS